MAPNDADFDDKHANDDADEELRVEAVNVDYYMSAPLPAHAIPGLLSVPCYLMAREVPVVRIFGATPAGQKALVHVHAESDKAFDDPDELRRLLPRVAMELEKANDIKQQQQQQQSSKSTAVSTHTVSSRAKIVAKLLIVQGTPFYGYHAAPKLFVQIFLYNPRAAASVVQILESGCIAERRFQTFESHFPFLLQVFADYNIEGMNAVHLAGVKFRAPLPTQQAHLNVASSASTTQLFDVDSVHRIVLRSNTPATKISGVQNLSQAVLGRHVAAAAAATTNKTHWFSRQSSCALEIDVAATNILNPKRFESLQTSLQASEQLRNVPSLAAIWEEERQRRRLNGECSALELSLTLKRHFGHESQRIAATAASQAVLSQSFFQHKMKESLEAVLQAMARDVDASAAAAAVNSNNVDKDDDRDALASSSPVASCGHAIATESAFAFSQAVGDSDERLAPAVAVETSSPVHNTSLEDDDIMSVLFAMQSVDQPEWQRKVSAIYSQATATADDDGDNDALVDAAGDSAEEDDRDELERPGDDDVDEDDDNGDTERTDEISDILAASQAALETIEEDSERDDDDDTSLNAGSDAVMRDADHNSSSNAWWEVGESEPQLSTDSFSDVGGKRTAATAAVVTALATQATTPPPGARRHVDQQPRVYTPSRAEDAVLLQDIEDLLPPQPPLRMTSAHEVSVRIDPRRLSLTPQPKFVRRGSAAPPRRVQRTTSGRVWLYNRVPPTIGDLRLSGRTHGVDDIQHAPAFYSDARDIPDKAMLFGGHKFDFAPRDLRHLAPFEPLALVCSALEEATATLPARTTLAKLKREQPRVEHGRSVRRVRTPARLPPDSHSVHAWLTSDAAATSQANKTYRKCRRPRESLSASGSQRVATGASSASNLTVLSLEVFAPSRSTLLPDPRHDAIRFVSYAVEAQEGPHETSKTTERGVLVFADAEPGDEGDSSMQHAAHIARFCGDTSSSRAIAIRVAASERELFVLVIELVQHWDPDFLTGFEVQKASIGYLVDRANQLDINLIQALSRLPSTNIDARNPTARPPPNATATDGGHDNDDDGDASIGTTWGVTKASGMWIHGRYILNLWRMARSELKLSRYAFEDVVRAVLKREFPIYAPEDLTTWHTADGVARSTVVRYTLQRAMLNLEILTKMQLITRTSEMARLFGIDFYSVLSRGSQYRVEAVMLRVTKRRNLLLVSPNRAQVASQPPMECIPLVMEPHSSFYADPVVVLDFQSLYPSLVIGYNLCYSTYMGRLQNGMDPALESVMGVIDLTPSPASMLACQNDMLIIPNGALFCPKSHREGVLPLILDEILSTRIMVKKARKHAHASGHERLEKVLNARQLALKMISNVTYGYTAAGFSGRMPCAQLADAIVQSGRSTLEAAVRMVEANANWNARVVYGDTDSLFVLLKGRSKADAFRIGQEIADAVTAVNPKPVTLKLEKVYLGCVLVSKKRYVGNKFEHADQTTGVLEAKGVEIARRDSCGVVQRAMQQSLELLFATADLSLVKRSLQRFWLELLDDRLPLRLFVFAKEVRLGTYSNGSAPPAALVSTKEMARDPRAEPRYAERVSYVVVHGAPGARLSDLVVSPTEFVRSKSHLTINHQYYIHKQMIPSLERIFLLLGANIRTWFADLPKSAVKARTQLLASESTSTHRRGTGAGGVTRSIDLFYMSKHCRLCGAIGTDALCADCTANPQRSLVALHTASARQERALHALHAACYDCGNRVAPSACNNVTCAIWNRIRIVRGDKVTL